MHVLVTRPAPGCERTADRLRALGHQPLVIPMTRTVAITENQEQLQNLQAGAYVMTSAAAVRHWPASKMDRRHKSVPVYVVGEATGRAANDAGFSDIKNGGGDSVSLAERIVDDATSGHLSASQSAPIVYVAGRLRQFQMESIIDRMKLPLRTVEIYDTQEISYSTNYLIEQILPIMPLAVILYSQEGTRLLFKHLRGPQSDKILKNSDFLCLSSHIATAVPCAHRDQTHIAAAPNEAELLALLDQLAAAR